MQYGHSPREARGYPLGDLLTLYDQTTMEDPTDN